MAFGFGEQKIIAAVAGAWVTAFVLVAIWMPSVTMLWVLAGVALVGAVVLWMFVHYKFLAAYAVGSAVTLIVAALLRSGML